jgi:SAM-dependent methyltransferase
MPSTADIRAYWNGRIHDLEIAKHPVGSAEFFAELAAYRFEKLAYLPRLVDFDAFQGCALLEIGCGVGTDLIRFAQGGAIVTGVDLAETAVSLARQNFAHHLLPADLRQMDGEALDFEADRFDVVYAHGVLQYTLNPERMIAEIHRVLRPGGLAILMFYNKYSWLNGLSKLMSVELEHEDAPVLRKVSIAEFKRLLRPFSSAQLVPERFPVETRLHHGWKGRLYNGLFVRAFNTLPRRLVRPLGWHLMAFATK